MTCIFFKHSQICLKTNLTPLKSNEYCCSDSDKEILIIHYICFLNFLFIDFIERKGEEEDGRGGGGEGGGEEGRKKH